jgi:SAM-dependent methyltransferase
MADLSQFNPTSRFTGLAETYARYRPDYPSSALDCIQTRLRLGPNSLLVDVGCGTGISARLVAARGIPVLGIEPNPEMRQRAETEAVPPGAPQPRYLAGRAEATGLPDWYADAVLAAQAFHWFDPTAALAEFHRILKRGGGVALMWNERDESDTCTADYGSVIRSAPDAAAVEAPRSQAGEPLLSSPLFTDAERLTFVHEQSLDEEGLLGRAFSASYAPREAAAAEMFAAGLRRVFARHQRKSRVLLRYETSVYLARAVP